MWVLTEVADWFDKTRKKNDAWIDQGLQPWVATTLYKSSPWYRNVGIYTAAGTLYSLNKFTTTVASGFVDVLRVGDGVREGGWGWGKDALRILMVVGPAVRGARYAVTLVKGVDLMPTVGNCTWVAAARMLRLTGVRPLAELSDVAKSFGVAVKDTAGIWPAELAPAMRSLGADASLATDIKSFEDLAKIVGKNPNAATMFSVAWDMAGEAVGHSLFAVRDMFGGITIIDRSGMAVKSLSELDSLYAGIGSATIDGTAVITQNSMVVKSLGIVPMLTNIITQTSGAKPDTASSPGSPAPTKAQSLESLSPDARRLYAALPPATPVDWKLLRQKISPPLNDPNGSLQSLEKAGLVSVTRFGQDELNIRTVTRL